MRYFGNIYTYTWSLKHAIDDIGAYTSSSLVTVVAAVEGVVAVAARVSTRAAGLLPPQQSSVQEGKMLAAELLSACERPVLRHALAQLRCKGCLPMDDAADSQACLNPQLMLATSQSIPYQICQQPGPATQDGNNVLTKTRSYLNNCTVVVDSSTSTSTFGHLGARSLPSAVSHSEISRGHAIFAQMLLL